MVDVVSLGSTEASGYEVLAFIGADGTAYPLLVDDPAYKWAVRADYEDRVQLPPSTDYDCISIMGWQDGRVIPANPKVLPIMAAADFPFFSFQIGLTVKTTEGVYLNELYSQKCVDLDGGNYYAQAWSNSDDEYSCTFVNPIAQDSGLTCDKSAFNLPAPNCTRIAACFNDSSYDGTDAWLWENMAAYWLVAMGVDESIIPRRN